MISPKGIWLDPRTKGLLLIFVTLSATLSPAIAYNFGLVLLITLLGVFLKKYRYAFMGVFGYGVICLISAAAICMDGGTLKVMLIAGLGLFHKVYPCGMLAGILITTTKVSEFLCAMYEIHVPRTLTISIAVMLRYVPTIREDWAYIKDAMELRDVSPSFFGFLRHPARTIECIYVPLMMAASRAADELSIAAVTRGIENPAPRTCLTKIGFGIKDVTAVFGFFIYFAMGQLCKEVFL